LTRRALRARDRKRDSWPTQTLPFSDAEVAALEGAQDTTVTPATGLDDTPLDDLERALADGGSPMQWADKRRPATALAWLDTTDVEDSTLPADLNAITMVDPGPGLLADARLRPAALSGRWLAPIGVLAALAIAYSATMLLW